MELNSTVTEFILLGLTQDILKEKLVFVIFLFLYLATLFANLFIVMTIRYSRMLGGPMYFFLFYLFFADACYSTTTVPRLILHAISKKVISYNERMAQIFAGHFFGCMEIFVLILMSFDLYVAICKPLRYTTIMSQRVCGALLNLAWDGLSLHGVVTSTKVIGRGCANNIIVAHQRIDQFCFKREPIPEQKEEPTTTQEGETCRRVLQVRPAGDGTAGFLAHRVRKLSAVGQRLRAREKPMPDPRIWDLSASRTA
ncbi:olfactory receptor 4C11-like [Loxodonta africana]|uniref:olfactory receptor 4C11-like n=1 Tax=Loxodonta africana TaxID=9785 RepID=UPI0030D18AC5